VALGVLIDRGGLSLAGIATAAVSIISAIVFALLAQETVGRRARHPGADVHKGTAEPAPATAGPQIDGGLA
jgi:hypothetical protein